MNKLKKNILLGAGTIMSIGYSSLAINSYGMDTKKMNYAEAKALAQKYNQEHIFDYYSSLSPEEKQKLIESISKTDFSVLKTIDSQNENKNKLGKLTPTDVLTIDDIRNQREEYEKIGIQALQRGEVAAVLLAGGDGTRLNSPLPKGMYNIGIEKTLPFLNNNGTIFSK